MTFIHIYDLGTQAKNKSKEILLNNLSQYLGRKINLNDLSYNENGKPEVDGIRFSVSHSRNQLIQIFTSCEIVGIDIEYINYKRNFLALANRYFHRNEALLLNNLNQQEALIVFYNLWTRKEAICKAHGDRLWYYLQDNYLDKHQHMSTIVRGLELISIDEVPGFSLTIAISDADEEIKIFHE